MEKNKIPHVEQARTDLDLIFKNAWVMILIVLSPLLYLTLFVQIALQ